MMMHGVAKIKLWSLYGRLPEEKQPVRVADSRLSHVSCFSYGRQQLSTVQFIVLNRYRAIRYKLPVVYGACQSEIASFMKISAEKSRE
jgi:hypothetical protein